jgi:hypothetical protein
MNGGYYSGNILTIIYGNLEFKDFIMAVKSKLNVEWHKQNRMPAKATIDQRIAWHIEHHKH